MRFALTISPLPRECIRLTMLRRLELWSPQQEVRLYPCALQVRCTLTVLCGLGADSVSCIRGLGVTSTPLYCLSYVGILEVRRVGSRTQISVPSEIIRYLYCASWMGRHESNVQPPGSEPGALPIAPLPNGVRQESCTLTQQLRRLLLYLLS